MNNQNMPEYSPTDDPSPTKLVGKSGSKESNTNSETEDKRYQLFGKNKVQDSEREAAVEEIEVAASSQLSSSLITNRRKKIKQLVSSLEVPRFLIGINIFGYLSVLGLVVMSIVSYVILSEAYYEFSQYAQVAPFPSYLNSVVKSVYTNTEQAVGANLNFYPAATVTSLKKTISTAFANKVQMFLTEFNQYMVNYNVEGLSPHFRFDDFQISVSRQGIFNTPQNISIFEASTIFLGVIYKVNKTAFSQFTSNLSEIIWLEEYCIPYMNVYEDMRTTLYSDFYLRYQNILSLFDIILAVGAATVLLIVTSFALVFKSTERSKSRLMMQVLTIPHDLIRNYLNTFQTEYKEFFGSDITNKVFQLPSHTKAKTNHKKEPRHALNTFHKKKDTGILLIAVLALVPILYVMAYYVTANIYFKYKTREAIPYIKNIDMQSGSVTFAGTTAALFNEVLNLYNTTRGKAAIPLLNQYLVYYKDFRDNVDNMMQTANATLLATDYASDLLIQRYANISTIHACDDIITNANYQTCLTAFNGAAKNGLAGMLSALYDYTSTAVQIFMANPTLANILQLYSASQVKDKSAFAVAVDPVVTDNIEIEGTNLAGIMQTFQTSLNVLLIVGILQMASLLFLIWRPINRRITVQYLNCRRVYAVLPIFLIVENKHILKALKLQQNSRLC